MMVEGTFYFIKNEYFLEFNDKNLMKNKEIINGKLHERPCYYSYLDIKTGLMWFIPISSQVSKYENIYNKKILKSPKHKCDTIVFGYVLGEKKAFLIQNMCPVTAKYINNEYIDKATNDPVFINDNLKKELNSKAKKILGLTKQGFDKLIFPDVLAIEKKLLEM
jgi:hypothetical protein